MSDSLSQVGFIAPKAADLTPLFPGYEFQRLIATGGMGAVYSVLQKSLDRTVALKILPLEFSQDAAYCAGFEAEAKAMARLNHPNLIGVFDFGSVDGMLFIIMEFVAGKSIYDSAHGVALDQMEVVRLVTGICSGLAHAHENGIIHRDIKPSNILLDLNAQPKIGDFGLARPIERKVEEGEEIFGTPHYTAPEVVDSPNSVDYRADIFSIGVMLHELLTGKLPAQDPRSASMIARCDPGFDAIVKKATQSLPAARYSSATEISKDLEAIALSFKKKANPVAAVAARRQPTRARVYRNKPQKSSNTSSLALLLLGGAAAAAAYVHFSQPPQPNPAPPTETISAHPKNEGIPKADGDEESHSPSDEVLTAAPSKTVTPSASANATAPSDSRPSSTHSPNFTAEPKSDVPAFFARARKIMRDRTHSLVAVYRRNLLSNFGEFERLVTVQLHKSKIATDAQAKALTTILAEWKAEGGTIPERVGQQITAIPSLAPIVEVAHKRQVGIEDSFKQAIMPHSDIYILGLEKEIERLEAKSDPGAIKLIQDEITKAKKSPRYFSDLLLSTDSDE